MHAHRVGTLALSLRLALSLSLSLALALSACGGGEAAPRTVATEDPVHLLRIGAVWEERGLEEGFLEDDPQGVAFYRVESVSRVTFVRGGAARQAITRHELFKTKAGAEFHCESTGTVEARAAYRREGRELRVALENGEAALPRSCREPGFPVPAKRVARGTTVFALRSERLVAIDPPRSRAVLLPVQ